MASLLKQILNRLRRKKRAALVRRDSVTGRNHTFSAPYLSKLEGAKLQIGQSIVVRGKLIDDADELTIALTSGPCVWGGGQSADDMEIETAQGAILRRDATLPRSNTTTSAVVEQTVSNERNGSIAASNGADDDQLLVMKAALREGLVAFNACLGGVWGQEGWMRWRWSVGDDLDVRITCYENEFHIYLDHELVAKFAHYVPVDRITHVWVNGPIELYAVNWEGKLYSLPYTADLPTSELSSIGRRLCIAAVVPDRARRFTVSLQGEKRTVLQLEADFKAKKLRRRTQDQNGEWMEAEKKLATRFPFKRNTTFDLMVLSNDQGYEILVNDATICEWTHPHNRHVEEPSDKTEVTENKEPTIGAETVEASTNGDLPNGRDTEQHKDENKEVAAAPTVATTIANGHAHTVEETLHTNGHVENAVAPEKGAEQPAPLPLDTSVHTISIDGDIELLSVHIK